MMQMSEISDVHLDYVTEFEADMLTLVVDAYKLGLMNQESRLPCISFEDGDEHLCYMHLKVNEEGKKILARFVDVIAYKLSQHDSETADFAIEKYIRVNKAQASKD